jgi:8-oxo-dGTP pyrophosphatase MutT (NUDIX family)/ribosomal protein S18 acetylase RimI-like enzyme
VADAGLTIALVVDGYGDDVPGPRSDTIALSDGDVTVRRTDLVTEPATVSFAIEHADEVAGSVDLRHVDESRGQLTWTVSPLHRGRGVGVRAVRLVLSYAFERLGLNRVEAYVLPANHAALRLAGRAGLRREGLIRGHELRDGRRHDCVLLARMSDDPPPVSREGFVHVLNAALPRKRVITQGIVRNERDEFLLCELTYKTEWDLPGGVVEPGESPAAGLSREVREELGVDLRPTRLAAINWLPPWSGWDDACTVVFELGNLPTSAVEQMMLEPAEIRAVHWCDLDRVAERGTAATTRLLRFLTSADHAGPHYLEDGSPLV